MRDATLLTRVSAVVAVLWRQSSHRSVAESYWCLPLLVSRWVFRFRSESRGGLPDPRANNGTWKASHGFTPSVDGLLTSARWDYGILVRLHSRAASGGAEPPSARVTVGGARAARVLCDANQCRSRCPSSKQRRKNTPWLSSSVVARRSDDTGSRLALRSSTQASSRSSSGNERRGRSSARLLAARPHPGRDIELQNGVRTFRGRTCFLQGRPELEAPAWAHPRLPRCAQGDRVRVTPASPNRRARFSNGLACPPRGEGGSNLSSLEVRSNKIPLSFPGPAQDPCPAESRGTGSHSASAEWERWGGTTHRDASLDALLPLRVRGGAVGSRLAHCSVLRSCSMAWWARAISSPRSTELRASHPLRRATPQDNSTTSNWSERNLVDRHGMTSASIPTPADTGSGGLSSTSIARRGDSNHKETATALRRAGSAVCADFVACPLSPNQGQRRPQTSNPSLGYERPVGNSVPLQEWNHE